MPKKQAAQSVTLAFRLSPADRAWLEETARAQGVEVAQLVRWSLEMLRQYVEEHGGTLHLPIDIKKFWSCAPPEMRQATPPQQAMRRTLAGHGRDTLRVAEEGSSYNTGSKRG